MSNIIPPLLSSSPPPIIDTLDDEEDDEFGDFRAATDSYDCDELSVPSSIQNSPEKELKPFEIDFNSNSNDESIKKDFQDKRKSIISDENCVNSSEIVNIIEDKITKDYGCVNELNGHTDILSNSQNDSHLLVVEANFNHLLENGTNSFEISSSRNNEILTQTNCSMREVNEIPSNSDSLIENNEIDNSDNKFENDSISQDVQERTVLDCDDNFEVETDEDSFDDFQEHSTKENVEGIVLDDKFEIKVDEESFEDFQSQSVAQNVPDKNKEIETEVYNNFQDLSTTQNVQETILKDQQNKFDEINVDEESFDDFQSQSVTQKVQDNNNEIEAELNDDSKDHSTIKNAQETALDPQQNKLEITIDEEGFDDFQSQSITQKVKDNNNEVEAELNDDFQDHSATKNVKETAIDPQQNKFEIKIDGEGFDDFQNYLTTQNHQKTIQDVEETFEEYQDYATASNIEETILNDNNKFNTDLENCNNSQNLSTTQKIKVLDNNNDFDDDFGDFETAIRTDKETVSIEDDEFGEFIEPNLEESVIVLDLNTTNILEKTEQILKEIYQIDENNFDDYNDFETTENNFLFSKLKDLTETDALNYQWSKSASQKMFLKALNIDTRNILHGPVWNPLVPRFAANLSFAPLEPIKSDLIAQNNNNTSSTIQNSTSLPSNSSQINSSNSVNVEIPTAQFDWSDSGLINPLDYLEQLVANLDILNVTNNSNLSKSNQSNSPISNEIDDWDIWLQSSVDTPATTEIPEQKKSEKSLDSIFVNKSEENERHVSNNFEFPSTLTIRDNLAEKIKNSSILNNNDDNNFKSFQTLNIIPLRETHISSTSMDFDDEQKPGWLEPTIVTPELPRKIIIDDDNENDDFNDFQMVLPNNSEHIQASGPINNLTINNKHKENVVVIDDDEFTDFHSSKPVIAPLQPPVILPIEPLKPSIQYELPSSTTQINWPDPGVTDDDIKNIELNYIRHQPLVEEKKKENSTVDDEWSDFVSVQTINHIQKVTERTSTPDLPLSVLNLNNVQPGKQPIPVITPTGLVQTRLSSNIQPKTRNIVQTTIQPCHLYNQPTIPLQPSIISNQFASAKNLLSGFNSQNNNNFEHGGGGDDDDDDDDWSDFVSSQPTTTTANGFQQKSSMNSFTSTNIITNPGHFDSFQNYVPHHKNIQQNKKNLIPSISSIPDLDFIAPKNRTNIKK